MSRERELLGMALVALYRQQDIPAIRELIAKIDKFIHSPEPYKRTTPLDVLEVLAIYYTYHPEEWKESSALPEAFAEGFRMAETVYGIRSEK